MIPAEIMCRVLHIRWGGGTGTAFAYDRDGRQYVVTAKHVVADFDGTAPLEVLHNGEWKAIRAIVVGHDEQADVSVLTVDGFLAYYPGKPANTDQGIVYAQDVYFLGFPHGWFGDVGSLNNGYPVPFVKKAIVSAFNAGGGPFFLDGHNNPGFSGGPVVAMNPSTRELAIVGVISGYRWSARQVMHEGQATPLAIEENTGLIVAEFIQAADALIQKNPIGQPI